MSDQDGCCFERTFRSVIIFQIPSPINNNPNNTVEPAVRPIFAISSEERLAWTTVTIIPTIIRPPLIKSNTDTIIDGTFLLIMKAIIDIATAPPPKTIPRTCSPTGRKPCPIAPSGEVVEAASTSIP